MIACFHFENICHRLDNIAGARPSWYSILLATMLLHGMCTSHLAQQICTCMQKSGAHSQRVTVCSHGWKKLGSQEAGSFVGNLCAQRNICDIWMEIVVHEGNLLPIFLHKCYKKLWKI